MEDNSVLVCARDNVSCCSSEDLQTSDCLMHKHEQRIAKAGLLHDVGWGND